MKRDEQRRTLIDSIYSSQKQSVNPDLFRIIANNIARYKGFYSRNVLRSTEGLQSSL
jgi:hypothetical protein